MVKLEENKFLTEDKAIEILPLPHKVYIPLHQHLGQPCKPLVSIGERVITGQKIGSAEANLFALVHASITGKVVSIEDYPHPVFGKCKTVVIERDVELNLEAHTSRSQQEVDRLTLQELRDIIFESGIVGMGGATFPTHIKLNPPKPVDTLIINGAECEPYLTADYRLMVEKAGQILKGISLIARCLNVKNVYIAIEDNKPEAIKIFQEMCHSGPVVSVLRSAYPQGGEKQLVKSVLKREIPRGKLPFDIGVIVHNIGTIFAIYEAVYFNKPLYERVVTVTGRCLENPKNLMVRIGTPVKELIEFCGPIKEEPGKIIVGGPMMGISQYTDQIPVIKSTNGIILFGKKEANFPEEQYCIRCGACVRECPSGLLPCLINLASGKGLWQEAVNYGALDCIECGVCNYVCPANRILVQSIKRAKLESAR